jgi:hypothetical protein
MKIRDGDEGKRCIRDKERVFFRKEEGRQEDPHFGQQKEKDHERN